MTIVITGSNGFIGNNIINTLISLNINAKIIVTSLHQSNIINPKIIFKQIDIFANANDNELYSKLEYPDIIIHCAI